MMPASTTSTTNPLHILRGILRLVKTPPLPKELARKQQQQLLQGTSPPRLNSAQTFILQQYREAKTIEIKKKNADGPPTGGGARKEEQNNIKMNDNLQTLATNYYQLQKDIAERARLYELDTGAEVVLSPIESSRRAAARAGLQLPKLNHEPEQMQQPADEDK